MNIALITKLVSEIQTEIPFINGINNASEHEDALLLMDELIEDYDANLIVIDLLWPKIEAYELNCSELTEFHQQIKSIEPGASMLRLLMTNHHLKTSDFKNEIGVKSTVSLICNEKRKLTATHIKNLSKRFDISPALFF